MLPLVKATTGLGKGDSGFTFKPVDPNIGKGFEGIKSMTGNNINLTGQFRLDGQDLVVAVERANKARNGFI